MTNIPNIIRIDKSDVQFSIQMLSETLKKNTISDTNLYDECIKLKAIIEGDIDTIQKPIKRSNSHNNIKKNTSKNKSISDMTTNINKLQDLLNNL